jgi:POT family proton-dependent oligopeptide transporter
MTKYMLDSSGNPDYLDEAQAREWYHSFTTAVYFFPILGALISDTLWGKYRTILILSVVYCAGHLTLAMDETRSGLFMGLALIAIGSGGIKPCVSAHVGDQFGKSNQHLLEKVFGWFYFSINLGAFVSTLLTPYLLRNYGPSVAFGVPGVLMACATVFFWMGRNTFVHIPAHGMGFIREAFSGEGLRVIGKLTIIYAFVAMFWALFDQTGSAWVLQADKMDREFMGMSWMPSQIQAINPIMIMIFIPIFNGFPIGGGRRFSGLYAMLNSVYKLTPLRKIAIGFFLTVPAFAIPAWIEAQVQAGEVVNIGWQLLAYAIITAAEVFVSITCLEFSYTQSPKKMKSFVMACFLLSVSLGNLFVAGVNHFIQNPAPSFEPDVTGIYVFQLEADDGTNKVQSELRVPVETKVQVAVREKLMAEFKKVEREALKLEKPEDQAPTVYVGHDRAVEVGGTVNLFMSGKENDASGSFSYVWILKNKPSGSKTELESSTRRYTTLNTDLPGEYEIEAVFSVGDMKAEKETIRITATNENLSPLIQLASIEYPAAVGSVVELDAWGTYDPNGDDLTYKWTLKKAPEGSKVTSASITAGDQATQTTKLEGANYYWFFSLMMLITSILFLPVVKLYKGQTYIQDEEDAVTNP